MGMSRMTAMSLPDLPLVLDDLGLRDLYSAIDEYLIGARVRHDDPVIVEKPVYVEIWDGAEVTLGEVAVRDDYVGVELLPHPLRRDDLSERVDDGHEGGGLYRAPLCLEAPDPPHEVPVPELKCHIVLGCVTPGISPWRKGWIDPQRKMPTICS